MRLVNSSTALEGRVEVCHDGVWGPVCGGGLTEAYVICKILGYDAGMCRLINCVIFSVHPFMIVKLDKPARHAVSYNGNHCL